MKDAGEDQEDRTRGFVPPEPRGLGARWIALALAAVIGVVFVLAKVVPAADAKKPVAALQQAPVK
ncbi:hypothetical protein GCM10028796_18900 [Ramlibacter monticola]|uniref:Uncharacterized protein n=1 Tax=Ramlibacter monticola TaxID=1926872 RepID=A0A936Z0S5_9BURK|nr:hypothetical protein [Ramlibacter monticola]MBL0392151.1 hypothetical protein [Ramlibacter monticola]